MAAPRIAALLAPFLGDATLSDAQLAQLSAYLDLLLRWNARINLTAVRDPEQIITRHFGESLFTARSLYPQGWQLTPGNWLLDLGSGAGFPGLPVKIWAPALLVILLESKYRKAIFLREAVRALALSSVAVFPARAEEFDWSAAQNSMRSRSAEAAAIVNRQSSIVNSLTVTLRAVEHFGKVLPVAARLLASAPVAIRRLALLIGAAQVAGAREVLPAFSWSDPIAIPLSTNRVLLVGTMQPRSGVIR